MSENEKSSQSILQTKKKNSRLWGRLYESSIWRKRALRNMKFYFVTAYLFFVLLFVYFFCVGFVCLFSKDLIGDGVCLILYDNMFTTV